MGQSKPIVLVPTEFHPESAQIERAALNFCRKLDARAVILHALTDSYRDPAWHTTLTPLMPIEVHYEFLARKKLSEIKRFYSDNDVECAGILVSGEPGEVILREIRRLQPDYIVMGSKGRSAVSGVLGGTVERVLSNADCPVLVVPHLSTRSEPVIERTPTGASRIFSDI